MPVGRSLIVGGLALLLGACGGLEPVGQLACQAPACVPAADHYAAEVTSPTGESLVATEFDELTLDTTSGYFLVSLPTAARVTGVVQTDGAVVPGTVVFSRPSRIPGRPDVFYQATVDATAGTYQVSVPPNQVDEMYTVRVRPTDSAAFPPAMRRVHITADQTLDLSVASGARLFSLKGQITDVVNSPLVGTRVVLRDATTLLNLSTTTHTDEKGHFEIFISQDSGFTGSVLLIAERGDTTTGLLSLTLPLTAKALQAELLNAAMQLHFPAIPAPTHRSFAILGTSSSGADKAVAGAHVQLLTLLSGSVLSGGIQVTHEVEAQTDPNGKFDADVYPDIGGARKYTIAVAPPADSEFQTTTTDVAITASTGFGEDVRLATRPTVSGTVLDPSGNPLKGVVVQPAFNTVDATSSTSIATSAHTSSATSDVDGRFSLRLDVGTYDLALVPPASSQLPRQWVVGQVVNGDVDLHRVVAAKPVLFDGVVLTISGEPVKATLHLYIVPAGNAGCVERGATCLAPPRLQAEGNTDKNGRAPLLLPSDGSAPVTP